MCICVFLLKRADALGFAFQDLLYQGWNWGKAVWNKSSRLACMHVCAESLQSCPILWDPMDYSPPGSSLSMGFSRQEYWSGLPYPPCQDLPDPGIEPTFLMSPKLAGGFFTTSATWETPLG